MNVEHVRTICLALPQVTEEFPFDDTTLAFKVAGRMFAFLDLSEKQRGISLKCDPEEAILLREAWNEVTSGYHMNKKHWNTIALTPRLTSAFMQQWIQHAYCLVVAKLPGSVRAVYTI